MTLGRQIATALAVTAASSVIVYLVSSVLPKTYYSEQVLLFPAAQSSMSSLAQSLVGSGGGDVSTTPMTPGSASTPLIGSTPTVAMGILESRRCRQYVVDQLGLADKWRLKPTKAVEELKRRTRLKVDDSGFLVIGAESDSPESAREIATTLYDYLGSGAVELTINIAKRNRKMYEDRLKVAQASVDRARNRLVMTGRNHPYFDPDPIQGLIADAVKKQGETAAAIRGAEARISHYEGTVKKALASGNDTNALQAIGGGSLDKALEALAQDLQKRRQDLIDARKTYTEKSPEFKEAATRAKAGRQMLDETIAKANTSLQEKTYAPLIAARSDLESLKKVQASYDRVLSEYWKLAFRGADDASKVKVAQSEFETAVKTAANLQFQLEQAIIAEERDPARFEIVDEAVEDPDPIAPRKGLVTGAWAACCVFVSTGIIARKRVKFVD